MLYFSQSPFAVCGEGCGVTRAHPSVVTCFKKHPGGYFVGLKSSGQLTSAVPFFWESSSQPPVLSLDFFFRFLVYSIIRVEVCAPRISFDLGVQGFGTD